MEVLLLILGILCLLVGLAGAVLPLPGPPLSFLGLIFLQISHYTTFSPVVLWSLGIATLVISILDYYVPIWGTKKFGGTRGGAIGATAGLLVGFFIIPGIGIFLGTFLGALLGELVAGTTTKVAIKAALGSFIGFLTGIFAKVILCLIMIGYAVNALFHYFAR